MHIEPSWQTRRGTIATELGRALGSALIAFVADVGRLGITR